MTSSEIRQSFLDFFHSKAHTIVPSSSLLPDSPNLLFTNAGMNQFVPIFLGERKPDVSKWANALPARDTRAADTQKCIRAGGKHNDLDDVGLDTYHHTFFEMLGNWSFGDYFKKEAIDWAWELITEVWKFPKNRLYATVYSPDKSKNDPSEFDQEAWDLWAAHFRAAGLDPKVHIVFGNKKDNFWMMGDTGPCGPCSELHVDLTPTGDTKGSLVNKGDARCIEIWNLVFIQFNANPDGTFSPLPAKHVDTGMGFERVASIIQGTKNFSDFANAKISNYETDIFRPIFDEIEKLSGKRYCSTLPTSGSGSVVSGSAEPPTKEQLQMDVAFRVIADHIRTLSFAIADGILPGNSDRNYVLRRILRRAVRYGRTLDFHEPFFYKLVDVLALTMGDVFPEIRAKKQNVKDVLKQEEEAFNRTLDRGITLFENEIARLVGNAGFQPAASGILPDATLLQSDTHYWKRRLPHYEVPHGIYHIDFSTRERRLLTPDSRNIVLDAFRHFDQERYDLFALCVMPDHVHVLLQPRIKERDGHGKAEFWHLPELMHSIKSFTANEINIIENTAGSQVWENEYHDRLMRSDSDVQEKFLYICQNPWKDGLVGVEDPYPWVWTWSERGQQDARQDAGRGEQDARAPLATTKTIGGAFAFTLYDTYGFPLDLTELMARERGLTVDVAGFNALMEEQRARARAAQKKTVIELSQIETKTPTHFLGFEHNHIGADVQEVVSVKDKTVVVVNNSVCYAEMGGQVGDTGELVGAGHQWRIANTQKSGPTWLHFIEGGDAPAVGSHVTVRFDPTRRSAIERHHTVTHLLHWALHEVVSHDATQKGSFVGPDKLTFDFNSAPLTPVQVAAIERKVNELILANDPVSWTEVSYADVKSRKDVMQFFGDKYGDVVRVVQVGGQAAKLDGYSMELCGGTHVRHTGDIALFKILHESAIAAGVRRIEAVAGEAAVVAVQNLEREARDLEKALTEAGGKVPGATVAVAASAQNIAAVQALEQRVRDLHQALADHKTALLKQQRASQQRDAAAKADELAATAIANGPLHFVVAETDLPAGSLRDLAVQIGKKIGPGVVVLGTSAEGKVGVVALCSPEAVAAGHAAGKIVGDLCTPLGGKGGGKPDFAQGGGKDAAQLGAVLQSFLKQIG